MQHIGKLHRTLLLPSNDRYKYHRPNPSRIDHLIVCQVHRDTFGGIIADLVAVRGHMSSGPSVCIPIDISIELERV